MFVIKGTKIKNYYEALDFIEEKIYEIFERDNLVETLNFAIAVYGNNGLIDFVKHYFGINMDDNFWEFSFFELMVELGVVGSFQEVENEEFLQKIKKNGDFIEGTQMAKCEDGSMIIFWE